MSLKYDATHYKQKTKYFSLQEHQFESLFIFQEEKISI